MAQLFLSAENFRSQKTQSPYEKIDDKTFYKRFSKENVAHNVAMQLKNSDSKIPVQLKSFWKDFVEEYNCISSDYQL